MSSLLKNRRVTESSATAVTSFAENWTSPEFEQFVDDLANLVDSLEIVPGSEGWKRAEGIWARVVELEEMFWPEEGEEITEAKETGSLL